MAAKPLPTLATTSALTIFNIGSLEELVGKRSRALVFGGMSGQKEYRLGSY